VWLPDFALRHLKLGLDNKTRISYDSGIAEASPTICGAFLLPLFVSFAEANSERSVRNLTIKVKLAKYTAPELRQDMGHNNLPPHGSMDARKWWRKQIAKNKRCK
jgi:hypothetical protein